MLGMKTLETSDSRHSSETACFVYTSLQPKFPTQKSKPPSYGCMPLKFRLFLGRSLLHLIPIDYIENWSQIVSSDSTFKNVVKSTIGRPNQL